MNQDEMIDRLIEALVYCQRRQRGGYMDSVCCEKTDATLVYAEKHRRPKGSIDRALQALAVIACSETPMPPQVTDGKVQIAKGFSAEGHEECVKLAASAVMDLRL